MVFLFHVLSDIYDWDALNSFCKSFLNSCKEKKNVFSLKLLKISESFDDGIVAI